jgi:ribosomal protein S18 acetylase RimI-like enzyme
MTLDWLQSWAALPVAEGESRAQAAARWNAQLTGRMDLIKVGPAALALRREPWDCAQLGIEAGKIELFTCPDPVTGEAVLEEALRLARSRGLKHLASRIDSRDYPAAAALGRAGFSLVDAVVTLSLRRGPQIPSPEHPVRRAIAQDADALAALGGEALSTPGDSFNRYLNDPRLPPGSARRVYAEWARTSIAGPAADLTLVLEEAEELLGFLTLAGPKEGLARVPLNAVSRRARGRGIYRSLVRAGLTEAFNRGAERVEIVTQLQQLAVQRTWYGLGAVPVGSSFSFHVMLKP